jgi:ribosomal 30S subunit maturation factor RimM
MYLLDSFNQVLFLKNKLVYQKDLKAVKIAEDELHLKQIKDYEVIEIKDNQVLGNVKDIRKNPGNDLLIVSKNQESDFMIPIIKKFIKKQDDQKNILYVDLIEGLIDEN